MPDALQSHVGGGVGLGVGGGVGLGVGGGVGFGVGGGVGRGVGGEQPQISGYAAATCVQSKPGWLQSPRHNFLAASIDTPG